jgi:hypothetical protein
MLTEDSANSYPIERKYRRYDLQLPVCLSFFSGSNLRKLRTVSQNVSVGGVLLKASDAVPLHANCSLIVDVKTASTRRVVRLRSEGEVVRVESASGHEGFTIAVQCKRPLMEMEGDLSVAS